MYTKLQLRNQKGKTVWEIEANAIKWNPIVKGGCVITFVPDRKFTICLPMIYGEYYDFVVLTGTLETYLNYDNLDLILADKCVLFW